MKQAEIALVVRFPNQPLRFWFVRRSLHHYDNYSAQARLVAEHARLSIDVDGRLHDSPRLSGALWGYGKLLLP